MAQDLRLGFWNADVQRKGPGLLARDLMKLANQDGRPDQDSLADLAQAVQAIDSLKADVLVLSGFDYDAGGLALRALNAQLAQPYPHLVPLRPNTGVPTGLDLDGNGRNDEARDAMGFGLFPGQGGMALLSRLPVLPDQGQDHSAFLWRDLPGVDLPPLPDGAAALLRLSTNGHHDTALALPDGRAFHILTWHATTPTFDGPEDRNGKRNHDETRFWTLLLDGALPAPPPAAPFALVGQANADPDKGDGTPAAIQALLDDPRLQSPLSGDTSDYGGTIGPLRTAYILPSADLAVSASGLAPAPAGARHRPIWVDLHF